MNRLFTPFVTAALLISSSITYAQSVGIGTNAPDPSSKLHIVDNNRGLLIPQISIGNINNAAPVTAPAVGLLVWNNNAAVTGGAGTGFYFWAGTQWTRLSTNTGTDDQNLTGATLSGNNLTITIENGAPATVDLSNLVNDADAVIGNEYNTAFALSGRNLTITDGGGNRTVDLTSLVNDADAVIGNEYNTAFALAGRNLTITDGGAARTVDLTSLVNDADAVIGNEYNTAFALAGRNLTITDGGAARTVDLTSLVNDADAVIGNEYNTAFALAGRNLTITDGGAARTVDLTSLVNDADAVIGNEYNTAFTLAGTNLTITDGGGARSVNFAALNESGRNGLRNVGNFIHLGGPLIENTTVTNGAFAMNFNLNSTGDFHIQDNGVNIFSVFDNALSRFGGDVEWRDGSTTGTLLAQLVDDGNDGRFLIRENGLVSIDLDANSQFIFNEQGLDRDFRIESDIDPNMFRVNAGLNRIGIGDANPTTRLEIAATNGQTLMLSRQDATITGNEQLGGIGFDGSDGNTPDDIREASASIIAFASETHSTGDKGGRLTFWTSPNNQDDDTDGLERFRIDHDGVHYVGGDMYWRDASVTGTNIARMVDDGNDGQMIIYEDGITQILLDANGTSVFNERGLDRNVRIESDGDVNNFFADGGTNRIGIGTGVPAQKLHVVGGTRISTLAGAGNRMVVANANGDLATQAIPANGDITGVTAGAGVTGGGNTGTVTINAAANNGLYVNAGADRIRLGGALVENTTITNNTFPMVFNLNNSGDFHIQDNGINHFSAFDNGDAAFGGDVYWRDENTGGTILAQLIDDGNDGRFIVRENGGVSIDLDANSQFIFNEQGLDRNFRIESDGNANMFHVDAGLNRVSVGTNATAGTFNVQGNSYHSDDIYLRDGAVNGGDVLVRIFDSADDGIIDVYENNAMNHRIHGNGVSVFNEQGNNNADIRMESDNQANMFFLNAGTNRIGVGTGAPSEALHIQGGTRTSIGSVIGQHTTYGTHLLTAANATPSIQLGAMAYNQVESGRLTFEESVPTYPTAAGTYCGFQMYHNGSNNTFNIASACTAETVRLTLERTGDFGVATNNPTARLSVNGTANKTGGGNWAVFSDERLKKDITDYSEGLSLITRVRTVNFSYNDKMDEIWGKDEANKDRVYQGVIAQELQKIAPDMVREVSLQNEERAEDSDYQATEEAEESFLEVDPNKFTYALINAVKEQQAMIEAQQAQIDELKAEMKAMKETKE
ncbi:MAG: tail fiber domain-containing protein [Aureispira sp.]